MIDKETAIHYSDGGKNKAQQRKNRRKHGKTWKKYSLWKK